MQYKKLLDQTHYCSYMTDGFGFVDSRQSIVDISIGDADIWYTIPYMVYYCNMQIQDYPIKMMQISCGDSGEQDMMAGQSPRINQMNQK